MMFFYVTYLQSPLGKIVLAASDMGILSGIFLPGHKLYEKAQQGIYTTSHFENILMQLKEYFAGKRCTFDYTPAMPPETFSQKVLNMICTIPYGQTRTYQAVAQQIQNPYSVRAVGNALTRNNFNIIIPCHRVLASNGKLQGYNGGLDAKKWLLQHEEKHLLF